MSFGPENTLALLNIRNATKAARKVEKEPEESESEKIGGEKQAGALSPEEDSGSGEGK